MSLPERKILELFSGIGGMHSAFTRSQLPGHVIAAIDINTVANAVYAHNYPDIKLLTRNIQKCTPKFISDLNVNTILMSPPCQPFTRVGNQKDVDDNRTDALIHLCSIIDQLEKVDAILMENVKGFETSKTRDLYIAALASAGYHYQEFLLSPSQLGVPNTRYRYYCLARKFKEFSFKSEKMIEKFPDEIEDCALGNRVSDYVESDECISSLLPEKLLAKRTFVLDIACPESTRTMCFTKAYTHYAEGTGSVFCPHTKQHVDEVFEKVKLLGTSDSPDAVDMIKTLQLRYFTPLEVSRLMCFPTASVSDDADGSRGFSFPKQTTVRQKYRLLGNSVNVFVVSELIKLLFKI